ncbi:MAG TPA: hypothetical protein VF957_00320, partial [Bradyrhizobium sp.]
MKPSLRAKRRVRRSSKSEGGSNPSGRKRRMDCFVAFAPKKKQRVKALIFPSFFFASQAAVAMGCKVTSKPSRVIWFTS